MGLMSSIAMAKQVNQGHVSLNDALKWHLQSNVFPPLPNVVVDIVQEVFRRLLEEGEPFEKTLEEVVVFPKIQRKTSAVLDSLKLWPFVPGVEHLVEEIGPEMLN